MLRLTIASAPRAIPLFAALACIVSCSSADTTVLKASVGDPLAPAGEDGASGSSEEDGETNGPASPLYVLSLDVRTPDASFGYLAVVPSLTEHTDIDLSSALEFTGAAVGFGRPGAGAG